MARHDLVVISDRAHLDPRFAQVDTTGHSIGSTNAVRMRSDVGIVQDEKSFTSGSTVPLIPQQDIIVVTGPYTLAKGQTHQSAAAEKLRAILMEYPPCRIVSITSGGGLMHSYNLTAVIETI